MCTFEAIKTFIQTYGYAPTYRELCKLTGIGSTCTIYAHLRRLRNTGLITFEEGKPRTIRIVMEAAGNDKMG